MKLLSAKNCYLKGALAALLTLGAAMPVEAKALIGLTPVPPATAKPMDVGAIMSAEPANGVKLFYVAIAWNVIEPVPGKYNQYALAGLPTLKKMGFTPIVTITTIDNINRTVPYDLQTQPFNSPKMKQRWGACLAQVNKMLRGQARWVSLGHDVDLYLAKHPSETDAYLDFFEYGRTTIKAGNPGLPVGVTTTFEGCRDRSALVAKLNRATDFLSMTYYPVDARFHVRPVTDLAGDFSRMVAMAGSKQLLLQCFGCPADPRISSEDVQAQYVSGLFEQLAKYGDKIAGVNWFLLADINDIGVNMAAQYFQQDSLEFKEFMQSLGLKRTDGTARKGWNVFREAARNWGGGSAPPLATPAGGAAAPASRPAGAVPGRPAGAVPGKPAGAVPAMKPPVRQPGH